MVSASFFLLISLAFAAARPTPHSWILLDRREAAPPGFVSIGPPENDVVLKFRIGLYSNNIRGLEKALLDVSTPSSPAYGQHLSTDEIKAFVTPSEEAVTAVNQWLSSNGLNAASESNAGDWIHVDVPISKANQFLNANYETYIHTASGLQVYRTLSCSVPAHLEQHIQAIHPTTSFNNPDPTLPIVATSIGPDVNSDALSCSSAITPSCLQTLYNVPATPATQAKNRIAVSGFIDQFAQQADLQAFLQKFRPDISPTTNFTTQLLDGGQNPQDAGKAGIEANLDTQYTIGVATNVPTVFISVGNDNQDGGLFGFLDITQSLINDPRRPQVMTTSYGDNEDHITPDLASKLCDAYTQLGAAGTSILFASGDGGVAGSRNSLCTNFVPTFPAGCPFITVVGATTNVSEIAAEFSSGGFSNYFAAPNYQTTAVQSYLSALGTTNSGLFNRTGRAYPDVSAQGEKIMIENGGSPRRVAGTSASSPIFASVIALINDRLAAVGKPPLGFLNPLLYRNAAAFHDITEGSNPGCNTNGFPALSGWDAVTGLGTPDFNKLLAAAGL